MKKNYSLIIAALVAFTTADVWGSCCLLDPEPSTITLPAADSIAISPVGCLALAEGGEFSTYSLITSCTPNQTPTSVGTGDPIVYSSSGCLLSATGDTVNSYPPLGLCSNCVLGTPEEIPLDLPDSVTITALASSSNNCIAVGDTHGTVTILENMGDCSYDVVETLMPSATTPAPVTALAFSSSGCLVAGHSDNSVDFFSQNSGCSYSQSPTSTIKFNDPITSLAFSSSGCLLISSGTAVYIYTVSGCSATSSQTIQPGTDPVTAFALSPTTNCLAIAVDETIYLYRPTGTCTYATSPAQMIDNGETITAMAFTSAGCLIVAGANSTVLFPQENALTASISPANTAICSGTNQTLTAVVSGGVPGYTYQWSGPNGQTSTGSTLEIMDVNISDAGIYTLTVTDSTGCTTTTQTTILVKVFEATLSASPSTICTSPAQTSTLTATITGGAPDYSFTISPGSYHVTTPNNVITYVVDPMVTTTYTVTVTTNNNCTATASTTVTVSSETAPTVTLPITVSCSGVLTIMGTANANSTISLFNGTTQEAIPVTVTMMPTGNFTLTSIPLAPGMYSSLTLVAKNPQGCTASVSLPTVTIYPPLTASISGPQTACGGPHKSFSLTAMTNSGGNPPYTYAWTGPNGPYQDTQTITIYNPTLADAGIYSVTVSDSQSPACTATASTFVQVDAPGATLSATPEFICLGAMTTLTGNIVGGIPSYKFVFTDGTNQMTVGPQSSPTASVTYMPGAAGSANYHVTVTDGNGCQTTSNGVIVVVNAPSTPTASGSTTCNQAVTLTGTADAGNSLLVYAAGMTNPIAGPIVVPSNGMYSITTQSLTPGLYILTVQVTNNYGCTATSTPVNVTVPSLITVTITPPSQSVLVGGTISLTALPAGGIAPYSNYAWTGPNGFSQTGTNASISIPNATTANQGTYTVVVTDSNNCTGTANAMVTVT